MKDNQFSAAPGGEVVMYESAVGEVSVDVRLERETVWLTQPQMAELFGRDRSVISRHIRNAYGERELDPESTSAKFAQVRADGGRKVSRDADHYNLDMIISVGYREKSWRGTQFRIWATHTLRDHLVTGYTMNERRLAQRGFHEARQTLDLLSRTLRNQARVDEIGSAVLHIITAYTDTWRLLFEFDEGRLKAPASTEPATGALLFLLYLTQEGIEHQPNPAALTALTLLVAESEPANKDLMIRLIVNLMGDFGK